MPTPLIFNLFKPAKVSSHDLVRHLKRNLPRPFGKIGHFGTLDPFASGVLLIGVGGAQRLNNLVHDFYSKTYLAVGKLGISTDTGDYTGEVTGVDASPYLKNNIAEFPQKFIEEQIRENFLGDYYQSPHKFSAAKFEGRKLYQWAREGVEIKKEKVLRHILKIEVIRYQFPYLSLRFEVSSGTYIRSLFQEVAEYLGTHGHLISLVRERVGHASLASALVRKDWPTQGDTWDQVYSKTLDPRGLMGCRTLRLDTQLSRLYSNGVAIRLERICDFTPREGEKIIWVEDNQGKSIGLGQFKGEELCVYFNLPQEG